MGNLVWIDFAIVGIIAISALFGAIRGFLKELLSLIVWVGAFFIMMQFYPHFTHYFSFLNDELLRKFSAMASLFVATLIVGSIAMHFIYSALSFSAFAGIDRILGIIFGICRGIVIVALIIYFIKAFIPLSDIEEWKQSVLIPHFYEIIQSSTEIFNKLFGFNIS